MKLLVNLFRLGAGLAIMAWAASIWAVVLLVLLPWRTARIKACNHFGTVIGRGMMWLSGCPVTVEGREHADPARPAIYVSNHTSIYDIFLAIWLSPTGTVGVAKKQVVYYPFFGQLYALSGHLRIDRGHSERAVASMRALGNLVRRHGLSIFLWPEGTRSRDGRLLPFKKGVVHLALQTGLPVVPMVVTGAHRGWRKGGLTLEKCPIRVTFLPPLATGDWSLETIDEHLETLHARFRDVLPPDQLPVHLSEAA